MSTRVLPKSRDELRQRWVSTKNMFVQTAPNTFVQTAPNTCIQTAPNTFVQTTPNTFVQTTPNTFVQTTPNTFIQTAPNTLVQAIPNTFVQTSPNTFVQTDNTVVQAPLDTIEINTNIYATNICDYTTNAPYVPQCLHAPYNCVNHRLHGFWCNFCKNNYIFHSKKSHIPNNKTICHLNSKFWNRGMTCNDESFYMPPKN